MQETGRREVSESLEQRLDAAVRRYVDHLREAESRSDALGRTLAVLALLGFEAAQLQVLRSPRGWKALDGPLLQAMKSALTRESQRLSRLARSGRPAYALDRHIAVRRALKMLNGERAPLPTRRCLSGREVNARFAAPSASPAYAQRTSRSSNPGSPSQR